MNASSSGWNSKADHLHFHPTPRHSNRETERAIWTDRRCTGGNGWTLDVFHIFIFIFLEDFRTDYADSLQFSIIQIPRAFIRVSILFPPVGLSCTLIILIITSLCIFLQVLPALFLKGAKIKKKKNKKGKQGTWIASCLFWLFTPNNFPAFDKKKGVPCDEQKACRGGSWAQGQRTLARQEMSH